MSLIFFDLETTGADPSKDRIVQAAFDIPGRDPLIFKCNPGIPIEPGATEAHGIKDEDVASLAPFSQTAQLVYDTVTDATLVGYNCRRFDTVILHRELIRAGLPGLRVDPFGEIIHPEIDLFLCWMKLEPRTLVGALERFSVYVGEKFSAHDAWEDTRVLDPLMHTMMSRLGHDIDVFVKTSNPEDEIDRDGRLKRREDGSVVLSFGKHADKPIQKVPRDYFIWMLKSEFSDSTKAAVKRFLGTGSL